MIRRAALVLVALGRFAHAEPTTEVTEQTEPADDTHPVAAAVTLGSMYTVFAGWMYVAWYQHHKPLDQYKWGGDGWLGDRTYAGGADKFGHAWSTMSLARLGTEMLDRWGGYDRANASLVATAAAEALFVGVEVRDGFFFEFSFSDLAGDTIGAVLAYALSRWPRLDDLIDFRVEYLPSQMYLRKLDGGSPCPVGGCSRWNIAEDYSGETYHLVVHPYAIEPSPWTRYVDVTVGFDSRNYKPNPDPDLHARPYQEWFVGASLDVQAILDRVLDGRARKALHAVSEVFAVPYTTLPVLTYRHYPTGPVMTGGA